MAKVSMALELSPYHTILITSAIFFT